MEKDREQARPCPVSDLQPLGVQLYLGVSCRVFLNSAAGQ